MRSRKGGQKRGSGTSTLKSLITRKLSPPPKFSMPLRDRDVLGNCTTRCSVPRPFLRDRQGSSTPSVVRVRRVHGLGGRRELHPRQGHGIGSAELPLLCRIQCTKRSL